MLLQHLAGSVSFVLISQKKPNKSFYYCGYQTLHADQHNASGAAYCKARHLLVSESRSVSGKGHCFVHIEYCGRCVQNAPSLALIFMVFWGKEATI